MPFAGHPTLGTAHVVRSLHSAGDSLRLEMKAGVIPVEAKGDRWTLQANQPKWREITESKAELAAMLGLEAADIADRPLWVDAGKEQLMVPVRDADAVVRATPKADAFTRLKSVDNLSMAYVFADAGDAKGAVKARFFFPKGPAILEDPATGSACSGLGGWFCAMRPGADITRGVAQGDEILRPSSLYLSVRGGTVFVGGDVSDLARGQLTL
jgi:trans-2,3-dihydro-3-hydroxyanthranilate isomerase